MFEGMKRATTWLMVVLFACVTLLSHGCASLASQRDIESKQLNFWKPHLLYLQSDECKSLYVELNAVEGCEPDEEAITALQDFLEQYCDKPEGIRIVSNPCIPIKDTHTTRPEIIALNHMNIPEPNQDEGSVAYLHILFYDSSELVRKNGQAINPHVQMLPYPSAIYIDTEYIRTHQLTQHVPELLIHEVGHVLGLTWSGNTYSHCSHKSCLMHRIYRVSVLPLQKQKTKDLCNDCKKCLVDAQSEKADPRLSFQGPVMVRSEKDYQVLSLPGFVKLHFGPLDTVNWKDLLKEACTQVPRLARQPDAVAVMMSHPQPGGFEAVQFERAIANAKNDPCATVRLGVTAIHRQPAKPANRFKNSQDLLSKWY
jgi:hypothetical protein